MRQRATVGLFLCAVFAGCGGGGSSGSSLQPQVLPTSVPSPATLSSKVAITIRIPPASSAGASAGRRPRYVSANSRSASIAVNGATPVVIDLSANSSACTPDSGAGRTCTISVAAPVGTDTFAETLFAGADATGGLLSTGKTSATVVAGKTNVVTLSLDGVIAALSLSVANATPLEGAPAQIPLTVNFLDASGASIIGNDPFVTPVTLTDSDVSQATSLSKTTLTTPADAAALNIAYTGGKFSAAVIGASAGNVVAAGVTLTSQSSTTLVAIGVPGLQSSGGGAGGFVNDGKHPSSYAVSSNPSGQQFTVAGQSYTTPATSTPASWRMSARNSN